MILQVLFNPLFKPVFFTLHCTFSTPTFSVSWQAFHVNGSASLFILLLLSYLASCLRVLVVDFVLCLSNLTKFICLLNASGLYFMVNEGLMAWSASLLTFLPSKDCFNVIAVLLSNCISIHLFFGLGILHNFFFALHLPFVRLP